MLEVHKTIIAWKEHFSAWLESVSVENKMVTNWLSKNTLVCLSSSSFCFCVCFQFPGAFFYLVEKEGSLFTDLFIALFTYLFIYWKNGRGIELSVTTKGAEKIQMQMNGRGVHDTLWMGLCSQVVFES